MGAPHPLFVKLCDKRPVPSGWEHQAQGRGCSPRITTGSLPEQGSAALREQSRTRAAPAVKPAGRGNLLLLRQVTHGPVLEASPRLEMFLDQIHV